MLEGLSYLHLIVGHYALTEQTIERTLKVASPLADVICVFGLKRIFDQHQVLKTLEAGFNGAINGL